MADLVSAAPAGVDALRGSGDPERILRARQEPFFASAEVTSLLRTLEARGSAES